MAPMVMRPQAELPSESFVQPEPVQPVPAVVAAETPMTETSKPTRKVEWGILAVSTVMAAAMTALFIGPLQHFSAPPTTVGVVAGAHDSNPLTVLVRVSRNGQQTDVKVQPEHGLVLEALAEAASQLDGYFSYTLRGKAAFLRLFLDQANDDSGQWVVTHNGQPLSDLRLVRLQQGDVLTVTWKPVQ